MIRTRQILLIFIPTLVLAALGLYFQAQRYGADQAKNNTDNGAIQLVNIPIFPDDPIIGYPSAPLTIVNFADFGCEHCKEEMDRLAQILKQYQRKVKIIWKGLPVTRIPYPSDLSHDYAYCANAQGKFLPFANQVFANNDLLNADRLDTAAAASKLDMDQLKLCLASSAPATYRNKIAALASALKVQAVPAVFFHDAPVNTPATVDGWKALLGLTP